MALFDTMRTTLAAIALGLTLATLTGGCSGDSSRDAAPTPATSATTAPTVSVQTTCDLLFADDTPRLWSQAVTLVKQATDGKAWDAGKVGEVHRQLEEAAESSKQHLRPFIEKMAATFSLEDETIDTGPFKLAAREVANVCAPYEAL